MVFSASVAGTAALPPSADGDAAVAVTVSELELSVLILSEGFEGCTARQIGICVHTDLQYTHFSSFLLLSAIQRRSICVECRTMETTRLFSLLLLLCNIRLGGVVSTYEEPLTDFLASSYCAEIEDGETERTNRVYANTDLLLRLGFALWV